MYITVFTPTYNRAYMLRNLFNSLKRQSEKNFEWLIVDDGSTDDTENVVKIFIENSENFDIVYSRKENGGKHTAINHGVNIAKGDVFFIVDSDDILTDDAIQKINACFKTIKNLHQFAGIAGLKILRNNTVIGSEISGDYIDCTSLEREKYEICGDKAEVFYTEILKKFPFPVFEGEKFVTEMLVWNRIANDGYKIRWFNEPLCLCRYLPNGLSNTRGIFEKNFYGLCLLVKDMRSYTELPLSFKLPYLTNACATGLKRHIKPNKMKELTGYSELIIIVLSIAGFIYKKMRHSC